MDIVLASPEHLVAFLIAVCFAAGLNVIVSVVVTVRWLGALVRRVRHRSH